LAGQTFSVRAPITLKERQEAYRQPTSLNKVDDPFTQALLRPHLCAESLVTQGGHQSADAPSVRAACEDFAEHRSILASIDRQSARINL
jgi:hypothetical protein